jgi:hypothetical protein
MSDEEDLELQALQRQLDDAFQTTRPRRGFEHQLWAEVQVRRPWWQRVRGMFAGMLDAVRRVPPAPAAAVAVLLVFALGIGLLSKGGFHGGGASTTAGLSAHDQNGGAQYGPATAPASFGRLPAPALVPGAGAADTNPKYTQTVAPAAASATRLYFGPADLVWTGRLSVPVDSAPVFRYQEPSIADANNFAASLGASPQSGQGDLSVLGTYNGPGFTLTIASSSRLPSREPFYFFSSNAPLSLSSGIAAIGDAKVYLASHNLLPTWSATPVADQPNGISRVRYLRQFFVPGNGPVVLVDGLGQRYGLELDVRSGGETQVAGPMPVDLATSTYRIISAEQAVRFAVASPSSGTDSITPVPTVRLTSAQLVYVLVWAGDHSFYEPAFLFSGTFTNSGTTYVKRVLVPAVDPSQLSS